jgi:hypothetical protein
MYVRCQAQCLIIKARVFRTCDACPGHLGEQLSGWDVYLVHKGVNIGIGHLFLCCLRCSSRLLLSVVHF